MAIAPLERLHTTDPLVSLNEKIETLPQLPKDHSFGKDIDRAHQTLLDTSASEDAKREALRKWTARSQPCLFGRLAAKGADGPKGLGAYVAWLDDDDIKKGRAHVAAKIQLERRAWKDQAENGRASGFLIMFNSERLAFAKPSPELVDICVELSNLYLVEHAPIQRDVIYTEAVPFRCEDGQLTLFKAGCNIFYAGAHQTVNHDRRLPGGLMFSMNSPGHYAQSMNIRNFTETLEEATEFVRETAFRSVGNGGTGSPHVPSSSWHNTRDEAERDDRSRPEYIPENFDPTRYSAVYHTDVLVPTDVTQNPDRVQDTYESVNAEVWPYLILDYITTERFAPDNVNYGLFHGHPIEDCDIYHNPWPARVAYNNELFEY